MNQAIESIKHDLLKITKPGRYCGGEWGSITKDISDRSSLFHMAISFPDLYEIGMSNQALKILYNLANEKEDVFCERVFAPDTDFEELLRNREMSLFTLESGTECQKLDFIGFTIGYELVMTNVLNMLDLSGIALTINERKDCDPVIIAGGPAITNPVPYGDIFDAVFIGEAEEELLVLLEDLKKIKQNCGKRKDYLARIEKSPHFWTKQNQLSTQKVSRAVWNDFPQKASHYHTPIPSISAVQDHGVVEIMRGCPNKCRFCHAGVFYKPFRQKQISEVIRETDWLVYKAGFRSITLSSLSSGDYLPILDLVSFLNKRYQDYKVSFNLPSLRVNSVNLDILGELSRVRKSGLTFAVETPTESGQKGMNKEVSRDHIVNLLKEAKTKGWKLAKFYFMLGLPVQDPATIGDDIYNYLMSIQREVPMQFNVNIGTFIPKPHTPFQWSSQWREEDAYNFFRSLKDRFKGTRIRLNYHSPFLSYLEGVFSRGDESCSELLFMAYQKGARFDAWDDKIRKDIWREVIEESGLNFDSRICRLREDYEKFPWDTIDLGTSKKSLLNEKKKSELNELTPACDFPCGEHCGQCNSKLKVVKTDTIDFNNYPDAARKKVSENIVTMIGIFSKTGSSIFWGHLDVLHQFEMAFQRAGYYCAMTEGFNPKPKIDYAQPLSLGFSSDYEVLSFRIHSESATLNQDQLRDIRDNINKALPADLFISELKSIPEKAANGKKIKVMSLFGGSKYKISNGSEGDNTLLFDEIARQISQNNLNDYLSLCKTDDTRSFEFKLVAGDHKWNNPQKFIRQFGIDEKMKSIPDFKRIEMYCRWNGKLILFGELA